MARYITANIKFVVDEYFEPFEVGDYKFFSKHPVTAQRNLVTTHRNRARLIRKHSYNSYVEFSGRQQNSILFDNQLIGDKKLKLLNDILILGSLLTGMNWGLHSLRYEPFYPVVPTKHLDYICHNSNETAQYLNTALQTILDTFWQVQYENGFHIKMLFNHSNILNAENRFLSYIVIWEWLYPHLINPDGATPDDESYRLDKILNYILKYYWGERINANLFTESYKCIFYFLRNQFAHSGKLPLNRPQTEPWMAQLSWHTDYHRPIIHGIEDYLKFFGRLTQVVVLKTLGITAEDKLDIFNFSEQLEAFLTTGKID